LPQDRLEKLLDGLLDALKAENRAKGAETVFTGILPPTEIEGPGGTGPRYLIDGEGYRPFLRMNSNGYLGLGRDGRLAAEEENATKAFGVGPGAVRFISGTWAPHVALEAALAGFHGRGAAMAYSSAYSAVMGVLGPLIGEDTAVISDALNHNSIINAIRLARPKGRYVYPHLDMAALGEALTQAAGEGCRRAVIVTDGVFSMRGDHAPLAEIMAIAQEHDKNFTENAVVVMDDSHGAGAFGRAGRGTEEVTGAKADILIATLGKAFGVNGGYVTAAPRVIEYLRETSPFYIYSNPITPGEAAAAAKAVEIVSGPEGAALLAHLSAMTARFEAGLQAQGRETIPGPHPIVPLMVRDTELTAAIVAHLRENKVLATGLNYPVVPKGDEEIRFQVSADHTAADIDEALSVLAGAPR
jgi:glycine C-acetyltransferase